MRLLQRILAHLAARRAGHQLDAADLVVVGDAEAQLHHGAAGVVQGVAVAQHDLRGRLVELGEGLSRRLRASANCGARCGVGSTPPRTSRPSCGFFRRSRAGRAASRVFLLRLLALPGSRVAGEPLLEAGGRARCCARLELRQGLGVLASPHQRLGLASPARWAAFRRRPWGSLAPGSSIRQGGEALQHLRRARLRGRRPPVLGVDVDHAPRPGEIGLGLGRSAAARSGCSLRSPPRSAAAQVPVLQTRGRSPGKRSAAVGPASPQAVEQWHEAAGERRLVGGGEGAQRLPGGPSSPGPRSVASSRRSAAGRRGGRGRGRGNGRRRRRPAPARGA